MRTITTHIYTYDELSDEAKAKAVNQLRDRLAGPWWDDHNTESITEAMIYTLAEKLRTPGWDTDGSDGFTIHGLEHRSWSLDRDRHLALRGYLDRDNAPGLPWVDGVDQVTLTAERYGTTVEVIDTEPECTCPDDQYLMPLNDYCPQVAGSPVTDAQSAALEDAVTDAIHAALTAGEKELEYKTSAEYAQEIADNYEYTQDGHLYP
jgi:hypothetical protein